MCHLRKIKDKNFKVTACVKTFTVKPSTFSNLDPDSSYDVRFLCILYGRKAQTEGYNFRVEHFLKIKPEMGQFWRQSYCHCTSPNLSIIYTCD